MLGFLQCMLTGMTLVMPGAVYNPLVTLEVCEEEKCTHLYAVPSQLSDIFKHPMFSEFDLSKVSPIYLPRDVTWLTLLIYSLNGE